MRRAVLALLTTTTLAAGAIPASAGPPVPRANVIFGATEASGARGGVAWDGSCRFVAVADPTGVQLPAGSYWAAVVGAVVAQHPETCLPADGGVFCYLLIDGALYAPTQQVTTSGLLTAVRVPYVIRPGTSAVEVCAEVWFDGEPWSETTCDASSTHVESPPREATDLVDGLVAGNVDPLLCPALVSLAPGVPGVVIDGQGDSYVLDQQVYDC